MELLVVIAIVSIMAALAASTLPVRPATQLTQAGETLSGLATLARQHAVSKNALTVLLVAEVSDGGSPRAIVSIWDAGTTNQLEKWNMLPEGIMLTNSSNFEPDSFIGAKFRGQAVSQSTAYWFYPDGRMGNDPSRVPQLSVLPQRGGPNSYRIVFNPIIGTHKTERP